MLKFVCWFKNVLGEGLEYIKYFMSIIPNIIDTYFSIVKQKGV